MFESACLFDTAIGTCGLAWSEAGLTGVQLPEATQAKAFARITRHGAQIISEPGIPAHIRKTIDRLRTFAGGTVTHFDGIALDMHRHSPFERAAYEALRQVPWGETVTYGWLARAIAEPGASRAVGMALGRNSWPVIVPCHRVLASDGRLGGFSAYGGGTTKMALLAAEGVRLDGGQMALFE